MRKVSKEVVQQLEFDEVIAYCKNYAKGPGGLRLLFERKFDTTMAALSEELERVSELKEVLGSPKPISIQVYEDISQDLYYLEKENYTLDADSILRIAQLLENFESIDAFFKGKKKKEFPALFEHMSSDDSYVSLIKEIRAIFDEQGEVRTGASPQLAKIMRAIIAKEKEIIKAFDSILSTYKMKGLLTDNSESIKSGRRVLSLPAENKRIVKGIIHDESASGKTVYIEPSEVIQHNNVLIELENEKRQEIFRILRELSAHLRDHCHDIAIIKTKVEYFDCLNCKARVAQKMNAVKPKLSNQACLKLRKTHHPILKLKEAESTEFQVVNFDLELRNDNRILLISGPNAGGKSVTLKAVGLIHLMVYAGFLVPVDENSEIGDFESIYTDIGDLQDLNEGLSTYSSHLSTMNAMLENADAHSLVLIDEFGSGTDPKIGGSIAESMLKRFNQIKVFGVITTHYSNLKVYAYRQKGIVNGAMHFDEANLVPTYRLMVGAPGSSYAFEVAEKIGLHSALIKYARDKVGKKENAIEKLLVALQREKTEYDEKLLEIYDQRDRLDKLIKNYENLNRELVVKRKKHKIRIKEEKIASWEGDRAVIDDIIKKLKQEKNLKEAQRLKDELAETRMRETEDIILLKKEISSTHTGNNDVKEGSHVIFVDGEATGVVQKIKGKEAEVLSGSMLITVPLATLRPIKEQLEINGSKKINIVTNKDQKQYSGKLDIRGYTYTDAARSIEEFLDDAILGNMQLLEIVHGKGNGVLRKLLLEKLKEYKDVTRHWHPEDAQGGLGTTMVKF